MSNTLESTNGGISVIWKIEHFGSLPHLWKTECQLKWAEMESRWKMEMTFFNKETNKRLIVLQINKLDDFEPFYLSGNLHAVVGKSAFEINQFNEYDFTGNLNKMSTCLTPLEGIDWENDGFLDNDVLTICINLWERDIHDLLLAEYYIRSSYIQQECSFQWVLKSSDWVKQEHFSEYSIDVPAEFTDYFTMQRFTFKLSLRKSHRSTRMLLQVKDFESEQFCIHCNYKLEFRGKYSTRLPFTNIEWQQTVLWEEYLDDTRLITEEKWDHLATDLTAKIKIIHVSDCKGFIEKIIWEPNIQNFTGKLTTSKIQISKNTLQSCLHKLYRESKFCDVMLCVDDKTFPCHKAVLCARSPVFTTMFDNDMVEKETNVVTIDDVESGILSMFLNYLYLDDFEDEKFDSAVKLYAVADKYEILDFQRKCANIVLSCLSVDNVCEALNLADTHQDQDFQEEIVSYFCEHTKEIVKTSSWKRLLSDKPLLAAETLQAAVTKS